MDAVAYNPFYKPKISIPDCMTLQQAHGGDTHGAETNSGGIGGHHGSGVAVVGAGSRLCFGDGRLFRFGACCCVGGAGDGQEGGQKNGLEEHFGKSLLEEVDFLKSKQETERK
jgi:hypothetical protein